MCSFQKIIGNKMDIAALITRIKSKDEAGALAVLETLGPDCDLNEGHYDTTSLIEAILLGSVKLVKALVDKGADVNIGSVHAVSPLCVAAAVDNICMAKVLLNLGANIHQLVDSRPLCQIATPLHYSIENRSVPMAKILLSNHHDPNCPSHIYKYPLMESIKHNCPGIVKLLVECPDCLLDCRINKSGGWSYPPLYQAIFRFRRYQIVQILLDTGRCKLRFQSDSYLCVLLWRIRDTTYDHSRLSSMLLEAGADMDNKDRLGNYPIKSYIMGNHKVELQSGIRILKKVLMAGVTPTSEEVELVREHAERKEDVVFCDWMSELATSPRSLHDITRRYLRQYFGMYPNKYLDQLPLPNYLLEMVTLRYLRSL